MRKVLIIALFLIGVLGKAQIVGGFLPLNSTKSFTAANGTFSTITTTTNSTLGGKTSLTTLSVSSTSTLTGQVKMTNTLNLEGNTTWNTNQTNTLTTGNTGTVAVLSDAVFPMQFFAGNVGAGGSPADGATYYCGNVGAWTGGSSVIGIYMPFNATLVGYDITMYVGGVAGTAETGTLSIGGGTSYTLTTSQTYSVNSRTSTGPITVNFNYGDQVYIKEVCPTWATNPTNVQLGVTLWFVRRQ